jgi:hypothetical protein
VRLVHPNAATGYVLILMPEQPARMKPFLVRGGRVQTGKVIETYVTVPVRIGEDTDYAEAAQLHGVLAAGRAALALSEEEGGKMD